MSSAETPSFPYADRPWVKNYNPGTAVDIELSDDSLTHLMDLAVHSVPQKVALEFFGSTTSYAELGDQIRRVAEGLRLEGVKPGDRVALILPNCPQHVIAFYAVLRLGAIVVEHNPLYTSVELSHMFEDHRAKVAIVWDKAVPNVTGLDAEIRPEKIFAVNMIAAMPFYMRTALKLPLPVLKKNREKLAGPAPGASSWKSLLKNLPLDAQHPRPTAQDLALLQYTSGTTGLPKGVMLTHRNLEANARMGEAWIQPGDDEVIYAMLPLFHAYGMTLGQTIAVLCKARLVLFPTADVDLVIKAMKKVPPTILPAVPPIYRRLLDRAKEEGISLEGVRYAVSGAMSLPRELVREWDAVSSGYLIEGYGLSECSPLVACNPLNETRRAGSIGIPFPSTDVRIVNPETFQEAPHGAQGELWVRGPQVTQGYWNKPEETAALFSEDGWLRTGDIVRMDQDYFITIIDRIKEVIISGGFNISPSEVEIALRSHEAVADAAVVGLPTEAAGEMVVAAVTLVEGKTVTEEELREHCYQTVTRYKVPRQIHVLDELPRSMMGKPLRRLVKEMLEAKQ